MQFKQFYSEIRGLANTKPVKGILDVSKCRYWDAISIHDDIMVANWQKTISATKVRRLANETEIKMITAKIRPEFKRSARVKWQKLFRKLPSSAASTLKHPWELFLT